jgi:hypothetical protein
MLKAQRFYAKVHNGIMHNRGRGTSRRSTWIDARDIPLQFLKDEYGVPKSSTIHPHNIPGLAWDLERNEWRVAKNAMTHTVIVDLVDYDPDDPRTFFYK